MSILDETSAIGLPNLMDASAIVSRTLQIMVGAWNRLAKLHVLPINNERAVTDALYGTLVQEKRARFGITSPPRIEEQGATRRLPDGRKRVGIVDFKLIWSMNEDEYFGVECKRVGATDANLAPKYVTEGVIRFVSGAYCPGQRWGAMLGVVIDNDLAATTRSVKQAISSGARKKKVRLHAPWRIEKKFSGISNLYRTEHARDSGGPIAVLHLFVYLNKPV